MSTSEDAKLIICYFCELNLNKYCKLYRDSVCSSKIQASMQMALPPDFGWMEETLFGYIGKEHFETTSWLQIIMNLMIA